jgi:hypothetical protein
MDGVPGQPRFFHVPPQDTILAFGVLALLVGIAALGFGRWLVAVAALLAALALLAVFADEMRRRPRSRIAEKAMSCFAWSRANTRCGVESALARAEVQWQSLRLVRTIGTLQSAKKASLLRLGEAAYAEDQEAIEAERAAVSGLDERLEACHAELAAIPQRARTRIHAARQRRSEAILGERPGSPVSAG